MLGRPRVPPFYDCCLLRTDQTFLCIRGFLPLDPVSFPLLLVQRARIVCIASSEAQIRDTFGTDLSSRRSVPPPTILLPGFWRFWFLRRKGLTFETAHSLKFPTLNDNEWADCQPPGHEEGKGHMAARHYSPRGMAPAKAHAFFSRMGPIKSFFSFWVSCVRA